METLTVGNVAQIDDNTILSAISITCWRREWDSNPRYGFPHTRFPSVRLKPLGHLSGCPLLKGQDAFCKGARAGGRKFPQLPEYKRLFRPMIDMEDATGLNAKRCPDGDLPWWRPTVVAAKHGRGGIMFARALLFCLSIVAIAASTTSPAMAQACTGQGTDVSCDDGH